MTAVTPTADDLAAVSQGALTVTQACEFTGDSRPRIWQLMDAGVLDWFFNGRDRRITRESLVRYLAVLLAHHRAANQGRKGARNK